MISFRSVYSSSVFSGFHQVVESVPVKTGSKPAPSTTDKKGPKVAPAPKPTKTQSSVDVKSMTLMEFADVSMSSSYQNNRFPARSSLNEDDTFSHTEKGVGQFWKATFANGANTITQVRIKNRADCCGERLSKTNIFIGDKLCGRIPNIKKNRNGKWYTLVCKNPIMGDSVKL